MGRWVRRIGIGLGAVVGLVVVAVAVLYAMSAVRMGKQYDVPVALDIPQGAEAVARGRHIANTMALCVDCHGGDLGGKVLVDEPLVGRLAAPNLTPAGRVASFTDADWVRAIRHGVGTNGRSLKVMPSYLYHNLSDADLGAVIAYLKQLPRIERELPSTKLGPLARFGLVTNKMEMLTAEMIDHSSPRDPAPQPGPTAEYGRYIAGLGCVGCHGEQLNGKVDAFHDTPDITPHGKLAGWTQAQFIMAMRTGRRPDATNVAPEKMPWPIVGQMTDEELSAVYAYLVQLDRRVALEGVER